MSLTTLIIGYGNPGRKDDGLGPALIEKLSSAYPHNAFIDFHTAYQLCVEDALSIKDYNRVIFVDASIKAEPPFDFRAIEADTRGSFGSHSLSPQGVLELCQTLYEQSPKAYLLAIRGLEFDAFDESLSSEAAQHLDKAYCFIHQWLEQESGHA